MTTLSNSIPKCLSFYCQRASDKLYSYLKDGASLTLDDALRLVSLSGYAALEASRSEGMAGFGMSLTNLEGYNEPFDGFPVGEPLWLVSMTIEEWIGLGTWASALASIRLRDMENAKVREMAMQSPGFKEAQAFQEAQA
jgi:hypothetical protein